MSHDAQFRGPREPDTASRHESDSLRRTAAGPAHHALGLQRAAGNRATAAALQRMLTKRRGAKAPDESKEEPPEKSVAPTRVRVIAVGESVVHGTRWTAGEEKWWKTPGNFPNKVGEDGGVSFALDPDASPKTRLPGIILLQYDVIREIRAVHCASKGEFFGVFRDRPDVDACYADQETELSMRPGSIGTYLRPEPEEWSQF